VSNAKVHPVVPLSFIRNMTYLDYIFNPCSLLSVTLGMRPENFNEYVAGISRTNGSFIDIELAGFIVTGEIVSYSVEKAGPDSAPVVSLLLMPPGVARCFEPPSLTFDNMKSTVIKSKGSRATYTPHWVARRLPPPGGEISYTAAKSDSVLGAIMAYRKSYAAAAFQTFLATPSTHRHRLMYAMFPARKRKGGDETNTTGLFEVPLLVGDINFTGLGTSGVSSLNKELAPSKGVQVSYTASSQGLLNSAYTFMPRLAPTMSNMVGHYINETASMSMGPTPPVLAMSKLLALKLGAPDVSSGADYPKNFSTRTFSPCKFDPLATDLPLVWKPAASVSHLRTQYTYADDGSNGDSGHQITVMVGRFNEELAPQGG